MKAIRRRLRRLEARFIPQESAMDRRLQARIEAGLRRVAEARGEPYVAPPAEPRRDVKGYPGSAPGESTQRGARVIHLLIPRSIRVPISGNNAQFRNLPNKNNQTGQYISRYSEQQAARSTQEINPGNRNIRIQENR